MHNVSLMALFDMFLFHISQFIALLYYNTNQVLALLYAPNVKEMLKYKNNCANLLFITNVDIYL